MPASPSNRLLIGLPPEAATDLVRHAKLVRLVTGQLIQPAGAPVELAYFPLSGTLSVVAGPRTGEGEIGMIGREGTTALPLAWGVDVAVYKVVVGLPGDALAIAAEPLRAAMARHPALLSALLRYGQFWAVQLAETALANARHTVRERLARWLAMCADRLDHPEILVTHEALATALSVRRPGVTVATHELEGEGCIRATRGCIRILDRARLEAAAASGYGVPEREYERLFPRALPAPAIDGRGASAALFTKAAAAPS